MAATKTISVVTGGSNNATVTAQEIMGVVTDFIANGVVGGFTNTTGVAPTTGAFAVNAQASPNMTVRVTGGTLYQQATPAGSSLRGLRILFDTFEDVTIAANASGGTRYDFLYVAINQTTLANAGVNKDDVVTLVTSRSTLSTSDNGPGVTVGVGQLIAVITVTNGAVSIVNANISDRRVQTGVNAIYTPSKFSVYRNAAQNSAAASFVKVNFDTKDFDPQSNFDSSTNFRFTAPISGYYQFNWMIGVPISGAGTDIVAALYKNGTAVAWGAEAGASGGAIGGGLFQATANDYFEVFVSTVNLVALNVGGSPRKTYFSGYLVATS